MKHFFKAVVTATVLALASSNTAYAFGPAGAARGLSVQHTKMISVGPNALAPFAYIRFCVQTPADCQRNSKTARVAWNSNARKVISSVNRLVNRTMIPMNDTVESWNAGTASGDCEDSALTKRRALIKLGLPASALRIATARTSSGAGHAVLVVSTTAGDMVLDNRVDQVKHFKKTDLRLLRIASGENPMIWNAVYSR